MGNEVKVIFNYLVYIVRIDKREKVNPNNKYLKQKKYMLMMNK